ncbi:MAG: DUF2321 domain-containing protein [Candidatus Micrarchaeota archaeon]|nr:DUF2321 domain-containing protein [Candidatus Micrarchaeota archaeon]
MSGVYRVAQICLNGHLITSSADIHPQHQEKYCSKCGEKTITECPECKTPIRGKYEVEGVISFNDDYKVPSYCYNCGKPYPWTESALESAKSLINEDENLTTDEKQQFVNALPDLIVESPTPKTQVSVIKFKKFIIKVAAPTGQALKDIIVDIASETIKKSLGF